MKQISKILNCDCCKQFIIDPNVAMVFFEIDSEDRVTELHMSHKGACDTWGTSRSVELFDFTGRNALTVMGGLLEDYKW
ncbi:MAG: hypothetical protein H0U64_13225, partial [Gemmatimonadaceae bacterium]|nr:hypothetical protein [Gemmatimonadaceae bacterium]